MPKRLLNVTHLPGLGARFQSRDTDGDEVHVRVFDNSQKGDTDMLISVASIQGPTNLCDLTPHQARALRDFLVKYVPEEPQA
jgi:hypothetical protein